MVFTLNNPVMYFHKHHSVILMPLKLICFFLLLQDARDDVGGAQNAGMLGILVRTGELKTSQLLKFHFFPLFVFPHYKDPVNMLLKHKKVQCDPFTFSSLEASFHAVFYIFLLVANNPPCCLVFQVNTEKVMRIK